MDKSGTPKYRLGSRTAWLPIMSAWLVILVCSSALSSFYSADDDICSGQINPFREVHEGIEEVLSELKALQEKLEFAAQQLKTNDQYRANTSMLECQKFLKDEVISPLYSAHNVLTKIHFPRTDQEIDRNATLKKDPLVNAFRVEEIRKYISPKRNRDGRLSPYGTVKTYNTIGHGCVAMKRELEEYMEYSVGSFCKDDSSLGQWLMVHGCDPLPRRRCLARPFSLIQRSRHQFLKNCSKSTDCYEMEDQENADNYTSLIPTDFLIGDVLSVKPGEIRIGLDFGIGTGEFAARMKEQNVTIVSTALNLGAPFSEMIALKGLVPLYLTLSQRLPFFDNTMDLIRSNGLIDGWIDLQVLDFVLFDWDRVLRPGGLLWIDRFWCGRKDLEEYMYMFLQFGYKKHRWAVARKAEHQVFLSALLEKPLRS